MTAIIGVIFALFLIGYGLVSLALFLHWRWYAAPDPYLSAMRILFSVVSAALIGSAFSLFLIVPWDALKTAIRSLTF